MNRNYLHTNISRLMTHLKFLSLIFVLLITFSSCQKTTTHESKFIIQKGVNLSHWLSQDFGWEPKYTYIKESDIQFIDSLGFDHVRIPIDEQEIWDEQGKLIDPAVKHLLACLDWCMKYDLRAIVDLHIIRSHHFNAENEGGRNTLWNDTVAQQHFVNLWIELSKLLSKYPTSHVAYELLNEAVAPSADDWNNLFGKALAAVRKLEPTRVIVIGSNMWQTVQNVPLLKLPDNDTNLIISFHFYSPLLLTHYKASWTPLKYFNGKVSYPGLVISQKDLKNYTDTASEAARNMVQELAEPYNKERMRNMIKPAIEFAKSKNLPLYCGEFGCLPTVPRTDRLAYYKDLISIFNEEGIAYANWEYKGDFGIYFFDNIKLKSLNPDTALINILLGKNN
ncbi:MAG: glycoside hydrolase family 5 protein [Bacteroidales bacterium]|nr:glycoside hydrolase family 5 protein [Bacteroidales bacterium]